MSGKLNAKSLAKAAGYAVADSAQGYFWFKVLFPEERSAQTFNTDGAAWVDCAMANQLLDA
ncbi:hypothetical protein PJWF_00093 [Achromobacter phage JWF]|uniref:hypothetical protein n=1 Tax=Achromobacter phage JWF TaxID=1589748 RepID=UPI000588E5C3|nr:hypothetical protein AXJ13_gp095 [Achromobacter phage JWF]AJD82986.1 hypothetical protein PJWF_00093 [Achromobacter phage JWF]